MLRQAFFITITKQNAIQRQIGQAPNRDITTFPTRANTGLAVLQSTPKPPKMRRRNGPTERPTDRRKDRPFYRGASQHLKNLVGERVTTTFTNIPEPKWSPPFPLSDEEVLTPIRQKNFHSWLISRVWCHFRRPYDVDG